LLTMPAVWGIDSFCCPMVETIVEPKDVLCNRPELSQTVTRKQTPIADMTALRRGAPSIVKDVVLLISRGLT
jgi:hypothetical protein